jgi:hypothetical protein
LTDFATRLCELVESRLPLHIKTDGAEDDWDVVGPAILAASARHLRAISHIQATFPSAVVGWQLVRSLFEYVATYAWIAADPTTRAARWLKYDYGQRLKLDNDLGTFGETLLEADQRQRLTDFGAGINDMPNLVDRTTAADTDWATRLTEVEDFLPEDVRSFRRLYPLIYRNASRFTHPSSHVVAAFVSGEPPNLSVGDERALERDLTVIGSAIVALGLAIAATATPALAVSVDDVRAALSA